MGRVTEQRQRRRTGRVAVARAEWRGEGVFISHDAESTGLPAKAASHRAAPMAAAQISILSAANTANNLLHITDNEHMLRSRLPRPSTFLMLST